MLIGAFPNNSFPDRAFPERGFPGYAPATSTDKFRSKPGNTSRIMLYKEGDPLFYQENEVLIMMAMHMLDF